MSMPATSLTGSPAQVALGLLPPLVCLLLAALIAALRPAAGARLRESLLIAAVATGVWIIITTEVLSLFRAISFWPVLLCWLLPAALLTGAVWTMRRRLRGVLTLPHRVPWGTRLPLALTVLLLLIAGAVASVTPPNISDATIYHMPRQIYWLQHQSVEHYPTPVLLQLAMPPMMEYASLHLLLLSGTEVYSAMIQWPFLVLLALCASLIARCLGGAALAQAMAALLVVTNPMAWLQSTNVKNDVITAAWVLIAAWCILTIMRDDRCTPARWILLGAAAGLAAATKLTGIIFILPLLAILGAWLLIQRRQWVQWPFKGRLVVLPLAATVLAITLALNAPQFARNLDTFGTMHGSREIRHAGRPHTNETRAPGAIASVIVRNLTLHAGTPSPALNRAIERSVRSLHRRIGRDVDDPRTTIYETYEVRYLPWSDSVAGAPVHLILTLGLVVIVAARLLAPWRWPMRRPPAMPLPDVRLAALLLAAALGGFLLFCTLLKWQPWHARLHIGIIALLAPIIAASLCRGRGAGALIVCLALMVPMVPAILWNERGPFLGPRNILTTSRDDLRMPRAELMDELMDFLHAARPDTIGLIVWPFEYTLQQRILRELDYTPIFCAPHAPAHRDMGRPLVEPQIIIVSMAPEHIRGWIRTQDMELVTRAGPFRIIASPHIAGELHQRGIIDHLPRQKAFP